MQPTNLELPPSSSDPYLWADFVELRALIHPDRCYSRGDLVSVAKGIMVTAPHRQFQPETQWRDLISFAGARRIAFGDQTYPFAVSDDEDTLELRPGALTPLQRAYLLLLLASLLRHIPKGKERTALTRGFEQFSLKVFERLMPDGSQVHATGAGGGKSSRYTGTLFNKMKSMAIDIRATSNFAERDFKRGDSGDGGIDLVAWHPMADERKGIPAALATATVREKALLYLKMAGVDGFFEAAVCGDEVAHAKPAPDIFLAAAKALGVPAEECLVLEDSPNGLRAARAAGCKAVVVPDITPIPPESEGLWAARAATLADVIPLLECL